MRGGWPLFAAARAFCPTAAKATEASRSTAAISPRRITHPGHRADSGGSPSLVRASHVLRACRRRARRARVRGSGAARARARRERAASNEDAPVLERLLHADRLVESDRWRVLASHE